MSPKYLSKTAQISDRRTKTLSARAPMIGAAGDDIAAQHASPGSLVIGDCRATTASGIPIVLLREFLQRNHSWNFERH
jgi:hypothetical protein